MRLRRSLLTAAVLVPFTAGEARANVSRGELVAPPEAGATDTGTDETRDERGARLYAEGTAAYKDGRYAEAAVAMTAAYDLISEPLLLYNIALCHSRLGNTDEAISHYQRYRSLAPESEWEDIDNRIAELQEDEEQTSPSEPPPTRPVRPPDGGDLAGDTGPSQAPLDPGKPVFNATAAVLAAVAVVGVGIGTGLGIAALRRRDDAEAGCANSDMDVTVCTQAAEDDRMSSRRFGIGADVSFGIAGVSAIALIVVVATRASKRRRATEQTVSFAPVRSGGALTVRF